MTERLNRGQKFIIVMAVDGITAAIALAFSYLFIELTFDLSVSGKFWLLPTSSIVTVCSFYFFGLYQTILRFANTHFFIRVIVSSVIVSGLVASVALYSVYGQNPGFPSRVFVLFAITLSVGTACSRLIARWFFESRSGRHRTPTVIYGAGAAGHQLFSSIRYGGQYAPVAFVDDDPLQQGKSIHGIKVFSPRKLEILLKAKNIEIILLAMPILSQDQRAKIIAKLHKYNVTIKTIPMLETNQMEGIRNNIIGTKRVADACALCGVNSLVVVSTDKAVRPTNLMGATKRFAELLVQTTAINNPKMNVCMVRFGNVLGSSGSVVPL